MEWTVESVGLLARKWDERVRREVSCLHRVAPEIEQRGSVLREPADEEQIAEAEARLGVRLPPSYRAFLLLSNGAHASSIGAELDISGRPLRHGLVPVEEVRLAAEADARTVELWTGADSLDDPDQDRPPTGRDSVTVRYYQPLKQGLLISTPLDTFRDVLVPRRGETEWELWSMAFEGASAYRSFGDFLWSNAHRPEWAPRPDRADEYAEAAARGRLEFIDKLAHIGDPRAGPLAAEWLVSDKLQTEWERVGPARVLSKLGDPSTIPAMLRAYARASVQNDSYRVALLAGLDAAGAAEADRLIQLAAEDPNEDVRRWATMRLERDQPPG